MVTAIVPARNEEATIGKCIRALTNQNLPPDELQIVAIDDGSQDQTASIAADIARHDARVKLLTGAELPPGWRGKPHACWLAAGQATGDWLCFIDADTIAQPALLPTALKIAQNRSIDLLSLQPFQELPSPGERLILPSGFFLLAYTQDLRGTNDPASAQASVNGQFLLARRDAYLAVGGHAHPSVRNAIAEDSELAKVFKRAGRRILVLGSEGLLHTRMYPTTSLLIEGIARQASSLLKGPLLLLAALFGLTVAVASILLPVLAVLGVMRASGVVNIAALVFAAVGSLALLGTHIGIARYFRIPLWYGLIFPLGYLFGSAILLFAVWERARGQIRWKDRIYHTHE
jgi:chlorobactene glucosyltransferase